ncbi:hypothetical protein [Stutzerimonas stutzeri]|uniref:hypothetical protein n=1 Tax=Stutzerimonas stutzeri TaxID=316 RepID=UPI0015E337BE|nr:hypothetical protein [Stutzerimonas stutzeri]MBA1280322.1 hypothetical protein [Stutzerimonas stutzeri]
MKTNSDGSSNVLYGRFKGASGQDALTYEAIEALPTADPQHRANVLNHIKSTFKFLIRRPVEAAWIEDEKGNAEYDHSRPAYGPYGGFIGYYADGSPNHFISHHIDSLRSQRAFTRNAIELRCDALCLAVYVSGITQIDASSTERRALEGVRVVVYDHSSIKPTSMSTAKNPDELVDKLQHILTTTYNRLAREYNLAGFTSEFLTLVSSHKAIPNIRIDMQN